MEYHVMKDGNSLSEAAAIAMPGDIITVHAGVYREWVNPQKGGTEQQRIVYRAADGEDVTITGAEPVSDWSAQKSGVWKTVIPNSFFGDYNPYAAKIEGDWFFEREKTFHTGEVYINGKSMYEAQTLDGVMHPVETEKSCDKPGSLYTWYCSADDDNTTIWANFHEYDPRTENVEINVRPFVFWPSETGKGYITVRGFKLKQAATQWAPPTALQTGLIGPHWSKGWIIEDNVISDSKCVGISVGKEISTGDNEWTRTGYKGGTQREREVIFRALHTAGWSRENVGGHIIRNNVIRDCEQAGIVGHLGGAFCGIEHNHIYRIHYKRQFHGAEVGGIKLHAALDTQITRNFLHASFRGVWLDWQAQGTRLSRNVLYDNSSEDFMAEVCHGPYLVDRNLFLSKWAYKDMSSGGAFVHNLILGKFAACQELNRYTPYHFPHETAVYGVSNIRGGDNRFINNIFLRGASDNDEPVTSNFWDGAPVMDGMPGNVTFTASAVGTSQYDSCPSYDDPPAKDEPPFLPKKLPVTCRHNVYVNGAKPYAKETEPTVYADAFIRVEFTDRAAGAVVIHIDDAEKLNAAPCEAVTTETLGSAYHAEMRYENPDGTPLTFNEKCPGPFAVSGSAAVPISF
jgi:hypothetical protein